MPNWCDNRIEFSGPARTIMKIIKKAKGPHAQYNDIPYKAKWGGFEDIRLKALFAHPAESNGPIHDFCFHSLLPIPAEYRRFPYDDARAGQARALVGAKGDCGGYSKQTELWGVKWDIEATPEITHKWAEDGKEYMAFVVSCHTAWSPPESFAENVSRLYPDINVEIKYEESGMNFAGVTTYKNGECIFSEVGECICQNCDETLTICECHD